MSLVHKAYLYVLWWRDAFDSEKKVKQLDLKCVLSTFHSILRFFLKNVNNYR